jgi:UDP-N-acetylmuramoyl-L-alanyl-D-glutamate--2,6-diaminopimelate ligase
MPIKNSKVVSFFYNIPGAARTYHFLWAWLAARARGNPSKKIFVIGVTGTKGKTTTLELINSILEAAGKKTALLSSLRIQYGNEKIKNETGNSMPGRGFIQKFLHEARAKGCAYALVEVTSQGVALHRHRFIEWNMGVITNIAPEHIDWHGSYEKYRAAKLSFLQYVLECKGKVFLNRDDREYAFFANALRGNSARLGRGPSIKGVSMDEEEVAGHPMAFPYSRDDAWLKTSLSKARLAQSLRDAGAPKFLLSKFNEENIAVAVAIAKDLGISDRTIEDAITSFEGVPGRMEFVRKGGYTAIVDYAHTPESLEAAYAAARPEPTPYFPAPRLICVLSSAGGGRDRWKRPEMGKVADRYCDEIILADEDPYDEDPMAIMDEIEIGIRAANSGRPPVQKILDRRAAIRKAVAIMREGDVVIGTGKGSEEAIHVAHGKKIAWNEREVFEEELKNKFEKEAAQS